MGFSEILFLWKPLFIKDFEANFCRKYFSLNSRLKTSCKKNKKWIHYRDCNQRDCKLLFSQHTLIISSYFECIPYTYMLNMQINHRKVAPYSLFMTQHNNLTTLVILIILLYKYTKYCRFTWKHVEGVE